MCHINVSFTVRRFTSEHPPPPVRINNIIQVAQMYAGQNGPVAATWFQPSRFTELFRIAAAAIPGSDSDQQTWDSQMAFGTREK